MSCARCAPFMLLHGVPVFAVPFMSTKKALLCGNANI